jgi:hypothetical protein
MNHSNGDSSPSPLKGVRGAKVPSQQQVHGDRERLEQFAPDHPSQFEIESQRTSLPLDFSSRRELQ